MTGLRHGYGGHGRHRLDDRLAAVLRISAMTLVLLGASSAARAQAPAPPELRRHDVTVSLGVLWSGGYDIGIATAQLRGNGTGASAPPFTLFTADSRVTKAVAPDVRVGVALTPRIVVEGGAAYGRPRVGVAISEDAEAPAQALLGERLEQFQIDANVTWQLPIRISSTIAPFATLGAGYLRQLHQDRVVAETGEVYYGGAGARYWLRGGAGRSKSLGVRGDLRVTVRNGGIDFEKKRRVYPSVSLMLFVGL